MKIGILSDLHLPAHGKLPRPTFAGDLMVLAGDIGVGLQGVTWARSVFDCPVLYVPGNHEYYGRNIDTLDDELKANCAGSNVQILQNDTCVIRDVRFIGCTLWTDFDLYGDARGHAAEGWMNLNDYRVIATNRGGAATPSDTLSRHQVSRLYIESMLAQQCQGPTVVVTHHAPSAHSVAPRYQGDPLSPCFASNLDDLLARSRAALWIHGHVHDSFDYRVGETRVLCNPKGYAGDDRERESQPFRWDCTVEVPA